MRVHPDPAGDFDAGFAVSDPACVALVRRRSQIAACGGHVLPDMVEHSSPGAAEQAAQWTAIGAIATTPSCHSGGRVTSSRVATAFAFGR